MHRLDDCGRAMPKSTQLCRIRGTSAKLCRPGAIAAPDLHTGGGSWLGRDVGKTVRRFTRISTSGKVRDVRSEYLRWTFSELSSRYLGRDSTF